MKKVSVIVPIYNAEKHLSDTIDCIINQTYDNIEIILINDGSKDKSKEIIDKYKKKYSNKVIAVHQENQGVSITRNNGLKYVTGYYVTYMDNDDLINKNYIEEYVKANDNDYDIIIGGYIRKTYQGKTLFTRKLKNDVISPYIQLACWGKLYKYSFIKENNIKFLDTKIADDFYFNILAYKKTSKIKIIDNVGYQWMYNDQSLSNNENKKLQYVDELIKTLDKVNQDVSIKDAILEYFYIRTVIYYILFSSKKVTYKKVIFEYKKLFNWLKLNTTNYKKNKYVGFFAPGGEQTNIKIIIKLFVILQRLHLDKSFLFIYSKI